MTRQEKLKEIGNMHLSAYTSKFIIPVPHKFYENDISIFESIENSKWEIVNKHKEIKDYYGDGLDLKKGARRIGAHNIKAYIYNNMIPEINDSPEESFLHDSKTLVLNKKLEQKMKLKSGKNEYSFSLSDIDLWIFEEHISFFVLNIEIDYTKLKINELNVFNQVFRNFKFLELTEQDGFINLEPTHHVEQEILEDLKQWKAELSKENNVSESNIIEDKDLVRVSKVKPKTLEELKNIDGFGDVQITQYGEDIIKIIEEYSLLEPYSLLEYLLKLTEIEVVEKATARGHEKVRKSLLNIDTCDCTDQYAKNSINDLYSIYNTSTNAKLLLGMQTRNTDYEDGTAIEEYNEECMRFESAREMSILDEIPYYIASCTSFDPVKGWTSNDGYIYQLVNEGGLNIWKYSAGLTIHDSAAFIGLGKDGGGVVNNVNGSFYFIYMLNLYINFQTRYIEHCLIDDDFESRDINYWYKKLQKLKNQFVSDDIGIKFQENELNKSMSSALKMQDILSEVSSNLVETKSITASNTGIYMTLVGFIFVSLLEEPLKNIFSSYGIYIIGPVILLGYFAYKNRVKIRKRFKL